MSLDWSTFLLEIFNFLVLVWLLKRLLYRPVMEVIAQRQARVEKTLQEAKTVQAEAQTLREQYEGRLSDWEIRREQARGQLQSELAAQRQREMAALRAGLEEERERRKLLQARQEAAQASRAEGQALAQAGSFAAQLLAKLAGPEAEARMATMLIEELGQLPAARVAALRQALADQAGAIQVTSAYPLPDETRSALAAALAKLLGQQPRLAFARDEKLVAGLRLGVGPWLLRASVQDELEAFVHAGSDR